MCYLVQSRDWIFVTGCWFLSFAENMGKNIGKNLSKILIGKYSEKLLDHAKQSATDTLKTISKRVIQRKAEASGDFSGNEIADKITIFSKTLPQNISETFANEHYKEIPKERYVSSEERWD